MNILKNTPKDHIKQTVIYIVVALLLHIVFLSQKFTTHDEVWREVSKGVEDSYRPPTLRAGHP
jgi:hypothetical protein